VILDSLLTDNIGYEAVATTADQLRIDKMKVGSNEKIGKTYERIKFTKEDHWIELEGRQISCL
jgi:hypothetical protein